ncbi:MAG: hypothetical protein IPI41_07680 [Flavobacteriales bacterium]|nr:hypothetical protein [Flavobacteriales bacterium]
MEHKLLIHPAVLAAAITLLPLGLRAFDATGSLVSQGLTRDFIYHAPGVAVAEDLPLVFVFHGLGSTAAEVQYQSGFDAVADANNFVVVYPSSTLIGGDVQWNVYADDVPGHAGIGEPTATDDVVFVDDLIDWFCMNHQIDASRIYVTGFSNGGNFCYLLALQRPGKIAAFAPTSANLVGETTYMDDMLGASFTPVAIYHVHGDPDSVVPYPDAVHDPAQWTWPLSSFGSGDCGVSEYTSQNIVPAVDRLTWCDGSAGNGKRVELIRCAGLDHAWGDLPGYSASNAIWEFFSGYTIDAPLFTCAVGVQEMTYGITPLTLQATIVDNAIGFSRALSMGSDVRVIDPQGREVLRRQGFAGSGLSLPDLAPGCYRVNVREPGAAGLALPIIVR